jgi:hypothetical protein
MAFKAFLGFMLGVGLVGLISCAGSPEGTTASEERREGRIEVIDELDFTITDDEEDVLLAYEQAVRRGDHDLYREIVWGGVSLDFFDESGRRTIIGGIDAVTEFRLEFFEGAGPREEYRIGPIVWIDRGENHIFIEFRHGEWHVNEGLNIQDRDGRLMVVGGYVELPKPGPFITNSIQKLTDYNQNGFLEDDEAGSLSGMVFQFFLGSHNVANPVDEFFDTDGDAYINADEIRSGPGSGVPRMAVLAPLCDLGARICWKGHFDKAPSDDELRRYLGWIRR